MAGSRRARGAARDLALPPCRRRLDLAQVGQDEIVEVAVQHGVEVVVPDFGAGVGDVALAGELIAAHDLRRRGRLVTGDVAARYGFLAACLQHPTQNPGARTIPHIHGHDCQLLGALAAGALSAAAVGAGLTLEEPGCADGYRCDWGVFG